MAAFDTIIRNKSILYTSYSIANYLMYVTTPKLSEPGHNTGNHIIQAALFVYLQCQPKVKNI